MSRCCGGSSVTSRSPILIVPPVTASSPAIILSTVDLPLPDGPTRTISSPSATSRLRSRAATKPFAYTLSTCSSEMRAIRFLRSSLDSSGGQTLHDSPLEQQYHRGDRSRCNNCGCENLAPGHLVLPAEKRDRYRHRLPLGSQRKRESKQELVPAVDERENRGCRQARHSQRQQYLREALPSRCTVDVRCLLEISRDLTD